MSSLFGIVLFVLVLMLAIFFHEGGHYLTARLFGMRVERFFLGFGRTLWSFRRGETEYGIKAIPLGGFCKIAGMTPYERDGSFLEEDRRRRDAPPPDPTPPERQFRNKPAWQRAIVLAAGSITHFLVAFLLLYVILLASGSPVVDARGVQVVSTRISGVVATTSSGQTTPAKAAGLRPGDRIVALDGRQVQSFDQLHDALAGKVGRTVQLTYVRDGSQHTVPVTLAYEPKSGRDHGFLGVEGTPLTRRLNPIAAVGRTAGDFGSLIAGAGKALAHIPVLLGARVRTAAPSGGGEGGGGGGGGGLIGIIGVARLAGEAVAANAWVQFVALIIEFNVFVGLFNLIPMPPMDGGYLGFLLFEKLTRRSVDLRKVVPVAMVIVFMLLVLTAGLAWLDITNPVQNPFGK